VGNQRAAVRRHSLDRLNVINDSFKKSSQAWLVLLVCKQEKKIMAQLGIEPRSPALCLNSAGHYIARVIPLDHCAFLDTDTVSRPYLSLGSNRVFFGAHCSTIILQCNRFTHTPKYSRDHLIPGAVDKLVLNKSRLHTRKKKIIAQLGVEPRSLALCLNSAWLSL